MSACLAAHAARPDAIRRAWVTAEAVDRARTLLRGLARRRRPYRVVSAAEIEKVAGTVHHEGVCVEAPPPPPPSEEDIARALGRGGGPARAIYLDGVQNPHNLGAILRTAAHFGARAALGAEGELPRLTPAAMRVAEGGAEHVPVYAAARPGALLSRLSADGCAVIATSARRGADLYREALPARAIFVVGAEREGVRSDIASRASRVVAIPGTGRVESLNVSAAAAVLLAEHARSRGL